MFRLVINMLLGTLTTLAVVLPFMLNRHSYESAIDHAHAVVQQTQARAAAMETLDVPGAGETQRLPAETGASSAPGQPELAPSVKEVQQITQEAVAKGTMTRDDLERLRAAMEKLGRERREILETQ